MPAKDKKMPHLTANTDLIVALDCPRADKASDVINALGELPVIYKVGFELFMAAGPDIVRDLVRRKKRVFLDLKFHDIPTTVARAAKQATLLQVEMFTMHLAGGSAMFRAVADELSEMPSLKPKILGVSVLTSFDDVRWAEVTKSLTGHAVDIPESVAGIVEHATAWGADGVVCSALELETIRANFPGLFTVVPGIRPEGYSAHDQARVMTPSHARAAGAHAIVMGRPITESPEPRKVVEQVLKDLSVIRLSA